MDALTASFRSGNAVRSRSVGTRLPSAILDVPTPPARLLADWQREASVHLGLEPGDIEALPLARTRLRWPELRLCIDAVTRWLLALGVPDMLDSCAMALMASRGTRYHHDGARYGSKAFCNLFVSEVGGTDFHFPAAAQRLALARGTAVLFDPCQPHAIVRHGAQGFDEADFAAAHEPPQVFLTWELPMEDARIQAALGVAFEAPGVPAAQPAADQVWRNGAPLRICPRTGRWHD